MNQDTPQHQDTTQNLVIGRKPVLELLAASSEKVETVYLLDRPGKDMQKIMEACREHRVKFKRLSGGDLQRIFAGNHQGVIARVFSQGFCPLDDLIAATKKAAYPLILALDQVQDPGNLGTLCRTLHAFGGKGIMIPKNRTAFPGPAASRASAGALEKTLISQVTNLSRALEECKEEGFFIYATGMNEERTHLFQTPLQFPAVLVLGNEEKGIRQGVLKRCDATLTIPMSGGFDSLNVAQAGAVIMGQFLRTLTENQVENSSRSEQ